jgi:hypothetical protein
VKAARLLEAILACVIVGAAVGLALDDELGLGLALAGSVILLAWWRFRLPPP